MNISQLGFNYRRLLITILLALIVYGGQSYFTMPASEDPKILIRNAVVVTNHPGMSPEKVEALITKKLEEEIIEIPEVSDITSSSITGMSIIHVSLYDRFFNLDQMWDDLRVKVNAAQSNLPTGTYPSQVNSDFGDVAVITLALTGADYTMREKNDFVQHIRDLLYSVAGTKNIDISGVQEERVYLEFSDAKLANLGIPPALIIATLQQQNIIDPGGTIDSGSKTFIVEPSGNFESIDDIKQTLINLPGLGNALALQEVVDIKHGYIDPPQQKAYFNGDEAVILAIGMHSNYNILNYSPRLKAKIQEIQTTLPAGLTINIASYQADLVQHTITGVTQNVIQTLVIVMLVVIFFLGLRTGLIVGILVPAVMLISLAIMSIIGIDLERMSLSTLIISLGLLVDNGIVITEDFLKRLEDGLTRSEALQVSGKEMAVPLMSSTLTTILVFLPLMLAEHVAGEYTRSISMVIAITLLTSWLVSLTLMPMLCYYFIQRPVAGESKIRIADRLFNFLNEIYRRIVKAVLNFRLIFIVAMVLLLVGSFALIPYISTQFFPGSDRPQILLYMDLPVDTSTTTTDLKVQEVLGDLADKKQFPHVTKFSGYIGYGGPRFVLSLTPLDPATNKAFAVLDVDEFKHTNQTIAQVTRLFANKYPEIRLKAMKMFLGPSDASVISIMVKGPDKEVIYNTALEVEKILRAVPDTIEISNDWEGRVAKFAVKVNQAKARQAGLTSSDVAQALNMYYSGRTVTSFRDGDDIFPLIMRANKAEREDLGRLKTLTVFSSDGAKSAVLSQIATIDLTNTFARIERDDLVRAVTVEGRNIKYSAEELHPIIDEKIQALDKTLPVNHQITYSGVIEMSGEAQAAMTAYMPMCLGLIFIVLMWQFNSFKRTTLIIATIPFMLIGAFFGLWILSGGFGFMTNLGLYALAGIIANNAIVLIDRIDIERNQDNGKTDWQAVISASVRRLRPILMSTTTTILGLLPLIINKDVMFADLSTVIAFGLGIGTFLTLGLVPVLYTLFFRLKNA